MIDFFATFIAFFAVIDPVGTVPVFLAVMRHHEEHEYSFIAFRAVLVAALVLIFFVVAGQPILTAIDIPLAAFQIAGGIILFLFSISMIFGESKPEEEVKKLKKASETAVFPLAIPSIASPGAMLASVMLTENSTFSIWEQFQTTLVMLVVLVIVFILMLSAKAIIKVIGSSGANIISRIMGLIIASIAVSNTLSGFKQYFNL